VSKFKPGDAVTYVPYHAHGNRAHPDCEHGIVTSLNAAGTIFVRFGTRTSSQGCTDDQLVHQFNRISDAGDGAPVGATAAKSDDLHDARVIPRASGPDVTSSQGTISETIEWVAVKDRLPDSDTTVLVCAPSSLGEPVWLAWYEDGSWIGVDACEYEDDLVVAWAHMPKGPA
jgi:hypothetical protein